MNDRSGASGLQAVRLQELRRLEQGAQSAYQMLLSRGETDIPIRIVRRRRKTLGIYIEPHTGPEVRVPLKCPWREIESFLKPRFDWIISAQAELETRRFHPPNRYHQGGQVSYLGQQLNLQLARSHHQLVDQAEGHLLVACRRPNCEASVEKQVLNWYRRQADRLFAERIRRLNPLFQDAVEPGGLVVRKMKSRWGSCSSRGEICLNLLLVKESLPQIDFVIAHELCHLRHFAHNAEFYDLLGRMMPDWRERESRLSVGG